MNKRKALHKITALLTACFMVFGAAPAMAEETVPDESALPVQEAGYTETVFDEEGVPDESISVSSSSEEAEAPTDGEPQDPEPAPEEAVEAEGSSVQTEAEQIQQEAVSDDDIVLQTMAQAQSFKATAANDMKTVTVKLSNMNDSSRDYRAAVWSNTNGQDDLKWYTLKKSGSSASVKINISDFKHPGKFTVHCYSGSDFIAACEFTITGPSESEVLLGELSDDGSFDITVNGLECASGIKHIRVAVWNNKNASRMIWYQFEGTQGKGNLSDFGYTKGTYNAHAYVCDGNGFLSFTGGTAKTYEPKSKLYVDSSDLTKIKAAMGGFDGIADTSRLCFAVWSDENGQDDLKWYYADVSKNVFNVQFSAASHKGYGKYHVHCYAQKKNGRMEYKDASSFEVGAPKAQSVNMNMLSDNEGKFAIDLTGLAVPAGIDQIRAAVWSDANGGNMVWYTSFTDLGGGSYSTQGDLSKHKNATGTYQVHVYVQDKLGRLSFAGGASRAIAPEKGTVAVKSDPSDENITVEVSGMKTYGLVKEIRVAFWNARDNASNMRWYTAKYGNGKYTVTIPGSSISAGGKYFVHCYSFGINNEPTFIGAAETVVYGNLSIADPAEGVFQVSMDNLPVDGSVKQINLTVSKDNTNKKYVLKPSQGKAQYQVPLTDFALTDGTYTFKAEGVLSDGNKVSYPAKTKNVVFSRGTFQGITNVKDGIVYLASLNGLELYGAHSKVEFAVWSDANGQDDLVWYEADENGNNYTASISMYNHGDAGDYTVHAYYTLPSGEKAYLNGAKFNVANVFKGELEKVSTSADGSGFVLNGYLGNLGAFKAQAIRVCVWSEGGSQIWYTMHNDSAGIYSASIDIDDHGSAEGIYNAHMYAFDKSGKAVFIDACEINVALSNYIQIEALSRDQCRVTVYNANLNGVKADKVQLPAWSDIYGADDTVWWTAKKQSDGSFSAVIDYSRYKNTGTYSCHVYVTAGGTMGFVNACNFSLGGLNAHSIEVMRKIMYAVETGGQVYGRARYDCFTMAYTNSSNEHAITIGAGAWYATEAKRLLTLIREADPALFKKLDTAGIGNDLDNENWSLYGTDGNGNRTILKDSDKAKCIQALISTDVGKAIQDSLIDEQVVQYVDQAFALGVLDVKAALFCANIRHLGGYSAMLRVVSECKGDGLELSMENLYSSMRAHNTHPNGVGADLYNSRHVKVMGYLNEYL